MAMVAALPSTLATAAGGAKSCSDAVHKCQVEGKRHLDINEKCTAAGAQCMNTGVFLGPYSGRKWTIRNR
jgi:hypothetical protein